MPLRAAVEPPRHLLPQRHLPVPQRQEQIVHALFGREKRRERREGDSGAQIHQHRVHRLGSELFGEFFADDDVADRLTLTEPQRLQGTGPVGPPCQLHVGEGLEQLLRPHAVQPLDCRVDRIRLLGCRLVIDTGDDGAVGVQRPFSITNTVWATVHLEAQVTAVLQRMQRQLHLARTLLGQDDRLIEEDIFHPGRRTNGGQGHRRIRRPGNDNGAVDDVIGQPWLRLDGQPAGVDGVAGGEILCTAQDSGHRRTVDGDAGRLGPEATALERIGGQFESATGLTMQRSEIGSVAADVGRGQRVGDLAPVANALAQRDDRPRRGQVLRPDLHRSPGQHRLRTDLHQHRASQRRHGAHTFGELHRLAGMPPPVLSVERGLGREHGAGAVADQRQRRHGELQLRCVRLEFIEHRLQQFRVEGVAGLQPGAADPLVTESGDYLLQILARTRQHRVGSVVGGDRHPREFVGDLLDVLGVGEHRHHSPTFGQAAEQPAALGHQPCPVLEAENPGHTCRRVLAHAVPQHHVGLDAPRLPQPGQTHLDGEKRWLRKGRVPQRFSGLATGFAIGGEQHLQQRTRQYVIDRVRATCHGFGENRLGVEQLARHPRILAALPGEQPRRRRPVGVLATQHTRSLPVLGQFGQALARTLDRIHDQRGPMFEMRTARPGGEAYVGEVDIRVGVQPGLITLRQRHQCFR